MPDTLARPAICTLMREPLRVAVIIPAYNEADRISKVLEAACRASLVDEILVVSDGSTDATTTVARQFERVRVLELPFNAGKGAAMSAGVAATSAQIVAFIDADLSGLRPEHIDQIVTPPLADKCDMCIGVFRGGKFWSDTAQLISPLISGQRAMHRRVFEAVPFLSEIRMGVEVALNNHAKRQKARILRVVLRGVSNTYKERKLGLVKGAAARAKMYTEIGRALVRTRKRKRIRGGTHQ